MNLLIIIFLLLLLFSFTDFMPLSKSMHELLFQISFFSTFFLFTIKYYYGGDIALYVPIYDNIESPMIILREGSVYEGYFEKTYLLFNSILRNIGFSYWMMTVVISAIYFYVIYQFFKLIPNKKIFALFLLVLLDYNLIFAAFRQCLSVSFFLLMVKSSFDKKYLSTIVFFILASLFHKSGLAISTITLFFLIFRNYKINKNIYGVFIILFVFMLFIPLREVILFLTKNIPFSEAARESLEHHLSYGKQIQVIWLFYVFIFSSLIYYASTKVKKHNGLEWCVLIGMVLIVLLYQYYYLLTRILSYFLPLLIVYFFNTIKKENVVLNLRIFKKTEIVFRQLLIVVVYVFSMYSIKSRYVLYNSLKSGIYNTSTIFSLLNKSKEQIKKEQLKKSSIYWEKEFAQMGEVNLIDKK